MAIFHGKMTVFRNFGANLLGFCAFYPHYPHPVTAVTIGATTDLKEDVHLEDCLPDSVGSSVFSTLPHGNFFGFNLFLGFSVWGSMMAIRHIIYPKK